MLYKGKRFQSQTCVPGETVSTAVPSFQIFFVQFQVDGFAMNKGHLGLFSTSKTMETFSE